MAPVDEAERQRQASEFRARSYKIFQQVIYKDPFVEVDNSAPHSPHVISRAEVLDRNFNFQESHAREALTNSDYRQLLVRLKERLGR